MKTIKYKSVSWPEASTGEKPSGVKLTVPDQSLSLQEILTRFTRNEPLPVGNRVSYHESDDDLEKIQHMDLVDREEFVEKLKTTQKDYEKQEKRKAKQAQEKLQAEALAKAKKELEKPN